jgi:outer membrane protein assembly factor BamB
MDKTPFAEGTMATHLILSLIAMAAPAEWPQFRGPQGGGLALGSRLPVEFSETKNVLWKTPIHDKGWSSPVIGRGQIWLTTATDKGHDFYAICIDQAHGTIVYDLKLFSETNPAFCHAFNSYASPTPALDAGRVYCHFGSHGTVCLDTATGKPIWTRRDVKCDHWRGPGSSPIVYKDLLICTYDGHDVQFVLAFNKFTGDTIWKADRNIKFKKDDGDYHKAYGTPAVITVNGQDQLVAPAAEVTIALDPATGKELWRVTTDGMNQSLVPIHAHGLIYLSAGHKGELLAVKAGKTGTLAADDVEWAMKKEAPTRPSVVVLGDRLYMVNDKAIAHCLDAKTGKVIWKERFDGGFSASPVSDGEHIWFCNQTGKVFVIKHDNEYNLVATNKLDDGFMASPAISGGTLYLRTRSHLYAIGTK